MLFISHSELFGWQKVESEWKTFFGIWNLKPGHENIESCNEI